MQAGLTADLRLPSLAVEKTVTLQSPDGKGLGFGVGGNAHDGFLVQDIDAGGVAGASGKISAGDRISGIGIGLDSLSLDDVRKVLDLIAPYPVMLQVNANASGAANAGVGITGPNISGAGFPGANIGLNGSDIDIKGPKFDFNANPNASVNLPSANVSVRGKDIRFGADVTPPSANVGFHGESPNANAGITFPTVDIEVPEIDIDLKGKKFGDKVKGFFGNGKKDPKGKFDVEGGGGVTLPNVNLDAGKVQGDIDISLPSVDFDGDINVKGEKPDHESWFDKHKPKISFGKSGKYSVADASANVDINVPSIDIDVPKIEKSHDVEIKGKLPKGSIEIPSADFNAGNLNISGPSLDISGKHPKGTIGAEGNIKGSPKTNLDIGQPKGGIHVDLPEFNIPDIQSPNIGENIRIQGPTLDINPKLPKGGHLGVGGDVAVEAPHGDIDIDIEGPSIDSKGKKGFGFGGKMKGLFGGSGRKKGKVHSDLNADVNVPSVDMDLSGPKGGFEANIETDAPDPRFDASGKSKGGFHMPKFGIHAKGPKVDLPKGSIDVDAGHTDASINVSGPKVDLDLKTPKGDFDTNFKGGVPNVDVDVGKPKGGFHVELPKFGFGGKSPKADIDIGKPHGGGDASLNLGGPHINIDANVPNLNVKKPKGSFNIEMPSFGFGGKSPKADIDIGQPHASGDASMKIGGPKVNLDATAPDINVKKPEGGFNIEMPSFGFGGKGPKADIDIGKPHIGRDASLNTEGGHVDIDANSPDLNLKKPKGSFNIEMPSFGFGGKSPKADIDIGKPHGSADACLNIEGPHVDVDANAPALNLKKPKGGFNIELPSLGFGGKGPKTDIDVCKPHGGGDSSLDIEGPQIDIDANAPDLHLKKPKGGFNVEMPSFGFGGKGPKAGIDGGKLQGSGDASLNIEGPHIDVNAPDVNLKKPKGGFNIEMPSFGFGGKGPKGDVDIGKPHAGGDACLDIEGPHVDIDANCPDINVKKPKGGFNIEMPKFGFGGKSPKGGVDINLPHGGAEITGPQVDLKIKKPHIEGDIGVDLKGPKIKGPDFGRDIQVGGPAIDIGGKVPKVKGGASGEFGVVVPKGDIDLDIGSPNIDIEAPSIDVKGKKGFGFGGKMKGLFGGGSGKKKKVPTATLR